MQKAKEDPTYLPTDLPTYTSDYSLYSYSPWNCIVQNIMDKPVKKGTGLFLIRSNKNRPVFDSLPSAVNRFIM